MTSHGEERKDRFSIDPASVAATRAELQEIVRGNAIAEAAVEGFNDWEVIEAMERLVAVATSETAAINEERSINRAFGLTES